MQQSERSGNDGGGFGGVVAEQVAAPCKIFRSLPPAVTVGTFVDTTLREPWNLQGLISAGG
jgi:hypothetical protein